ncbi:MAG: type II secretion system protein GspD [Kiritimatiellae bacterium]|nr:type II secretion system protein GspD [Kiritimatiellia bacterium]
MLTLTQHIRSRSKRFISLCATLFLLNSSITAQVVPVLKKSDDEKLVSVKFSNAPLDQVLEFYSDLTGRTIIKSPGVNANITLRARTRLTPIEALQAIESILAMNNVGFVPLGEKFLKVVQITTTRTEGMSFNRILPEETFPETDKLVSQIIDLKFIEIPEAQPILEQFKHTYGKIQPLKRANSLLITDTEQNLQRMIDIIQYIDQPIPIKEEIKIFELIYIKPSDVASKLNEIIADSQAQQQSQPRIATPTQPARNPAGVIRARRAAAAQSRAQTAAELVERGIIQGKVKIVSDDRTGILFIISRPINIPFFEQIITVLDRPTDPNFVVRVLALEYAEAEEIAGILNEFIGAASSEANTGATGADSSNQTTGNGNSPNNRGQALVDFIRTRTQQRVEQAVNEEATKFGRLSPLTKILADKRTNALMLMGQKDDIAALKDVIDQLDVMLGQVLIEVVILEVLLDDQLRYGVDWLQRAFTIYNEETAGPGGGLTLREPVAAFGGGQNFSGTAFIDASTVDRNTPLPSSLSYYATLFDLNLDAIIQLAATSSDARILSTPVILTADNTEAKIVVGEERPVVTTTSTTTAGSIRSSFEYRSIGINLTVTPRINPERFVVMEITQSADAVGGEVEIDGNLVPTITKREFSASVAVGNRETIILGGLVQSSDRESKSKVPILGDIPIIGNLFRSSTDIEARTELLVLITPYVLMTPEEVSAETTRLHQATQLRRTKWIRGWSDSKLAQPPTAETLTKKKKKSAKKKRKKRSKKEETTLNIESPNATEDKE